MTVVTVWFFFLAVNPFENRHGSQNLTLTHTGPERNATTPQAVLVN